MVENKPRLIVLVLILIVAFTSFFIGSWFGMDKLGDEVCKTLNNNRYEFGGFSGKSMSCRVMNEYLPYIESGKWLTDCEKLCYSKYQNETAAYIAGIIYCANATMGGNLTYG